MMMQTLDSRWRALRFGRTSNGFLVRSSCSALEPQR
jgi:hypothetical protein